MRLIVLLLMVAATSTQDEQADVTKKEESETLATEGIPPEQQDFLNEMRPIIALESHLLAAVDRTRYHYMVPKQGSRFRLDAVLHRLEVHKVNKKEEKVDSKLVLTYSFINPNLGWDPTDFAGITEHSMIMGNKEMYMPRFRHCFPLGLRFKHEVQSTVFSSSGLVTINVHLTNTEERCYNMDFSKSPWDIHACNSCVNLDYPYADESTLDFHLNLADDFKTVFYPDGFDLDAATEFYEKHWPPGAWKAHVNEPREWSLSPEVTTEITVKKKYHDPREIKVHYTLIHNPTFYNWKLVVFTLIIVSITVPLQLFTESQYHPVVYAYLLILISILLSEEHKFMQPIMMSFLWSMSAILGISAMVSHSRRNDKKED